MAPVFLNNNATTDLSWYPSNCLLIYGAVGQSFQRGVNFDLDQILSPVPVFPANAFMLPNGPLAGAETALDLVPAFESPTAQTRETPCSSFANNLIAKVDQAMGYKPKVAIILSAQSGQTLTRLDRGTLRYNLLIGGIRQATAYALRQGLIPIYAGTLVEQGQANNAEQSATYGVGFEAWMRAIADDAKAITGQAETPLAYVMQVAAGTRRDPWDASFFEQGAAAAQYDLCGDTIRLVGPDYQFPVGADLRHPNSVGYYRMGALFAEAVFAQTAKAGFHPIMVLRGRKMSATRIRLEFAVPDKGDLMLDGSGDVAATTASFYGFQVASSLGAECQIAAVTIPASPDPANINRRFVDIDTVSPIISGATVYFAQRADGDDGAGPAFGPRGNLRTVATYQPLLGAARPHWCPAFTKEVAA